MAKSKLQTLGYTPSIYQEKIFDFVMHGSGNAVISALAGSGKTTTIVSCMKLIPKSKKCLFLAFNKSIVETLSLKLKSNSNCHVKTMHSLGYLMIKRNLGDDILIDEYKYKTYIRNNISNLSSIEEAELSSAQVNEYMDNIYNLTNLSRYNLAQSEKEILDIAEKYGIQPLFDEEKVVKKVLKWGKENYARIDYTDMVWLPYELSLRPAGLQYDWIFFDEAQDASNAYIHLLFRCFKRGTRFIAVGDKSQCQPYGTIVQTLQGEKAIEDLKLNDSVISYDDVIHANEVSHDTFSYSKINAIQHLHVNSTFVHIVSENIHDTEYLFNHKCYAKFNNNLIGKYVITAGININQKLVFKYKKIYDESQIHEGLSCLLYDYYDTAFWIIKIVNTQEEAKYICNIHNNVNNGDYNHMELKKILQKYDLNISCPINLLDTKDNESETNIFEIGAINLLPYYMDVITFNNKNNKWECSTIINKSCVDKTSNIVSLDVDKTHNYVADGILTHNCINGFAGSNPESFDYLCNYPNTKVFSLPITYRCPKSVVNMAKEYAKDIQARDGAPDGEIIQDCSISALRSGDMVLARTKSPLLKLYSKLLKQGVRCFIKGNDIGINLINKIESIDKENLNQDLKKDGIFVRLYDKLFNDRNELMKKYGLSKNDATLTKKIMEEYDVINSLLILSDKIKTKKKLIEHINSIFGIQNDGIMLSTIHKAKGLEADNVYILCRSSMPSKLAVSDWEIEQENNLIYVAITRPKQKLGFISEKEIPPTGSSQDPLIILNDLRLIEHQVCEILHKEPMKEDENIEISKLRVKAMDNVSVNDEVKKRSNVKRKENKANANNDKIFDMLSSYLKDGGSIEKLKNFINDCNK